MAVEAMKPKFQPTPSRISAIQKCQRLVPSSATVADAGDQQQAGSGDAGLAEAARSGRR